MVKDVLGATYSEDPIHRLSRKFRRPLIMNSKQPKRTASLDSGLLSRNRSNSMKEKSSNKEQVKTLPRPEITKKISQSQETPIPQERLYKNTSLKAKSKEKRPMVQDLFPSREAF